MRKYAQGCKNAGVCRLAKMIEWSYARGVSTVLGVYHHKRCSSYMQGHVVACMGMQLRARAVTCKGLEVPLGGSRGPGSASGGLWGPCGCKIC